MTLSLEQKTRVKKAFAYWVAGFAVIAGFFYYHSTAPLGPILIAGIVTLGVTLYRASR